jgi:PAS domain S-box-containing protein
MMNAEKIQVLLIEDNATDALIVQDELAHTAGARFAVVHVEHLSEGMTQLQAQPFDVVLLDLSLPDSHGFETFVRLHDAAPEIPIVVLSGRAEEELALKAVHSGAQDYLVKGRIGEDVLPRSIRYAIERQQAERTLSESEERYRSLIEGSPNAYLVHCDGEIVFANAASLKLFGANHLDQLLGRSFLKTVSPEFHELISKRLQNGQANGSNPPIEVLGSRLDGTAVAVQGTSNPLVYEGKLAVRVVLHDITEQKLAEEANRASVERFELFMDNLPGIAWIKDQEYRYVYANKSCRQLSIGGREWFGKTDEELWPAELAATYKANDRQVVETKAPQQIVETILNGGEKRDTISSKFPILNDAGQVAFVCGIGIDITERRRAEEQMREQARLLDLAQDAILVCDMEDRVEFWNHGAEELYGWTAAEVHRRTASTLLCEDDPGATAAALTAVLENGTWTGECQHCCKDGGTVTVRSRWTLVRDELAVPESILIINTDITAQKKIEGQFLRAQRLESIGTLASGVAHDLNNILAPILMGTAVLALSDIPAADKKILSTMESCAQRGADIVKQVLTFARGVDGARLLLNPGHLVRDLIQIVEQTFPKTIAVRARFAESLWLVEGDPTQLHQVLLNLSVNARDAMPAGGRLTISVENFSVDEQYASMTPGAKAGPHVLFEVTDTGMGIPRQIVEKIFDPFFTTKELGQGTGLGLSTLIGIVKSHGGFVSVYSEIGHGTTFKIYLPATLDGAAAGREKEATIQPPANGELLLIVDDEKPILQVAQALLEGHGYQVLTAEDAAEALAIFAVRMNEIDLVLTDLAMPLMDGMALIRTLQKMKPTVRIVASTGRGDQDGYAADLASLKVRACLTKPYNKGRLLVTLHDVLNQPSDNHSSPMAQLETSPL